MTTSFSDVIRVVKPEGEHKGTFHAFCECCGLEVKACTFCFTRPEYINSWCAECYNSFALTRNPQPAETPHFLCYECKKWKDLEEIYDWEMPSLYERFEIVGYKYKPYCMCCPLSPTNYIREPYLKPIVSNIPPTEEIKRRVYAAESLRKEREFSGNELEAITLWFSFFRDKRVEYSQELKNIRKQKRKALAKLLKLR